MSDTGPRMRRIPLTLETYQHVSAPLTSKLLLNFYPEKAPQDARSEVVLMPCPGLTTFQSWGPGPILAYAVGLDLLYVVSGNQFYRINPSSPGSPELLGTIGTPAVTGVASFVSIAVGDTAVVVCVPPNAFTCGLAPGNPLNQIGGTFPGASSVAYLDGYFVFTDFSNINQFFISAIDDPLHYNALDFASTDAAPNVLRRVISYRHYLWFIGENATEVWYDSGDADFPLRRMPGGILTPGCSNATTVATGDASLWWLSDDGIVYRTDNFTAKRISTHAIEWAIRQSNPINASRGLFWIDNGHSFYAFTIGGRTFVYDVSTGTWHNRASSADGTGDWRVSAIQSWGGGNHYGDSRSARDFTSLLTTTTEDGAVLLRQAVMPPLWAGTNRGFCARLEVETEAGTAMAAGSVTLDWSDDGGRSWAGSRAMSLGALGAYRTRLYATRLGSFRQRMFRLTTLGSPTIYALDADIAMGNA